MPVRWSTKQYGQVLDDFRGQCDEPTWTAVLLAYAFLKEKGPLAGPRIAKKLKNADGIWELLAGHKNLEPRLLFYFSDDVPGLMIFVHAFFKKGPQDYKPAIKLAQQRRALIRQKKAAPNDPQFSRVH